MPPTSNAKPNVLFLIHGVGETQKGEMSKAVLKAQRKEEFEDTDILEVPWNEVVPQVWCYGKNRSLNRRAFYELVVSVGQSLHLVRCLHLEPLNKRLQQFLGSMYKSCDAMMWLGWGLVVPALIVIWLSASWLGWDDAREVFTPYLHAAYYGLFAAGALAVLSIIIEATLTAGVVLVGSQEAVGSAVGAGAATVSLRIMVLCYRIVGPLFIALEITLFLPLRLIWRTQTGKVALLVLPSLCLGGYIVYLLMKLEEPNYMADLVVPIVCIFSVLIVVRFAAYMTKAIGDIFHYVANPESRDQIQNYVHHILDGADEWKGEVIISAHSLGSVIAMDYLWNRASWPKARVTLLTGGSPLARFFFRYLPGLFFPGDAAACALGLEKKFARFRWFNFYRWFDYVGQRVGLPKIEGFGEYRFLNPFSLHRGYWGDRRVHRLVSTIDDGPGKGRTIYCAEAVPNSAGPWPQRVAWKRIWKNSWSTCGAVWLAVMVFLIGVSSRSNLFGDGLSLIFGLALLNLVFWAVFLLIWVLARIGVFFVPHLAREIRLKALEGIKNDRQQENVRQPNKQ